MELSSDGVVRLFCGGATLPDGGKEWLSELAVAGLAYRFVCIVADVTKATSFRGQWAAGFAATGLLGSESAIRRQNMRHAATAFPDSDFRRLIRVSAPEVQERPHAVAGRLVGRLIRVFETERYPALGEYVEL